MRKATLKTLRNVNLGVVALIGALVGPACSADRPPPPATESPPVLAMAQADPAALSAVESELTTLMADPGYRAVSVAVHYRGRLMTLHRGELASGRRPDDRTLYEIASITKTYTGLLLAQAVRDGKVELDAPVSSYLPDVDPAVLSRNGKAITLRHLATHMSGMPAFLACDDGTTPVPERLACLEAHDTADFLKHLATMTLRSDPGADYLYSNAGPRLIGLVLERRYGATYPELLQRFVFANTGERDTYCSVSGQERARLAVQENVGPACGGGSGLVTSTADFARYMAFYLSGDRDLVAQATTPLIQQGQWGRAYLWNTYRPDTEGMLYHGGGAFGTSSWVSIYPRERLGVFLVTPHVSDDAQAKLNETANAIVDRLRRLADED